MAYSDYGAFVYRNGVRRPDKEDVGVFDTEEGELPSGARIFVNILKNRERGVDAWWQHSQHGVLGDGQVRVSLYKQGLPSSGIYWWQKDTKEPLRLNPLELAGILKKDDPGYEYEYEYGDFELEHYFGADRYTFRFTDKNHSESGHYEARMTEPDGTEWLCIYDYLYGAGHTDTSSKPEEFRRVLDATLGARENEQ